MIELFQKINKRLFKTSVRAIDASLAMLWLSTYGVLLLATLFFFLVLGPAVALIFVVMIPAVWLYRRLMKSSFVCAGILLKAAGCVMLAAWLSNNLFGRMPGMGGTLGYWIDAGIYTAYMAGVLMLLSVGKWTRPVAVMTALAAAISHPVWEMTGALVTLDNVETLLGSSMNEGVQFLFAIPAGEYVNPLMLAIFISALICCPAPARIRLSRKNMRIAWMFAALGLLVFIKASPLYDAGRFLLTAMCAEHRNAEMTWKATGIVHGRGTEQNYIIVMGESMRFDALGVYGNPYDTTPFLSAVPHKLIERPVSPSGATMAAVPRELAITTGAARMDIQPQNNVVAFARHALGMPTYWLSSQQRETNQGLALAAVAESAEHHFYAKDHDDFALIKEFERILDADKSADRRFFVIHTYGAHEPACARVEDFGRPFQTGVKGKDWSVPVLANDGFIDCYLAAARKADTILAMIAQALEKRGQTYSVLFTSDHGASFYFKDNDFKCCRFPDYKELFEVPLIEFGTNVRQTVRVNATRETNRISDYVPTWLGVTTNLTEPNYDIFHPGSDEPYTRGENSELRLYRDLRSFSFKDALRHDGGK